jgi:hypothetical protein
MRATSFWRSPAIAEDYTGHDQTDFAQEFMRRDPDYRSDFELTEARIIIERLDEKVEMEGLARRWGMGFPLWARCARCRRARPLAARGFGCDSDDRHCAAFARRTPAI